MLGTMYHERLEQLRPETPELLEVENWAEATNRLGQPLPDTVLVPLFRAARAHTDSAWNSILLLLFWPSLEAIHRRRRRWATQGPEGDEVLWSDIVMSFYESVVRLDPERRSHRVAQKIFGDTSRRVYVECRKRWVASRHEWAASDEDGDHLDEIEHPDCRAAEGDTEWRCDREFRRRFYLRELRRGAITSDEYQLLCGTRLYGWTIVSCAGRFGIHREAAKKRLQRAERRIRSRDPLSR